MKSYHVYSTTEKVYIENKRGCVARLCKISGEFYDELEKVFTIKPCSFDLFKEEALKRGYEVEDVHRPPWDNIINAKENISPNSHHVL